MTNALTLLAIEGPVADLTFNRPERHNSLIPELMDSLLEDLDRIAATPDLKVLVLRAAGRSFSTGGDVSRFYATKRDKRAEYAARLVGGLNQAILKLLDLPFPVIGRIHGPITGGSLGFLLACDLAAITPEVFIQPYYTTVGFSPDGGWTALLPARIGAAKACEIQLLNRRVAAPEAVQLGLATALVQPEQLDDIVSEWIAGLVDKQPSALSRTKRLLLSPERRAAIAHGLEAEKLSFIEQIDSEEAQTGMARFLAKSA